MHLKRIIQMCEHFIESSYGTKYSSKKLLCKWIFFWAIEIHKQSVIICLKILFLKSLIYKRNCILRKKCFFLSQICKNSTILYNPHEKSKVTSWRHLFLLVLRRFTFKEWISQRIYDWKFGNTWQQDYSPNTSIDKM